MSRTPEYQSWKAIIDRVNRNPQYIRKGITVCDSWRDFANFLEDMGEKPAGKRVSVDRIDNAGNYEPSNCRWSTPTEQNNNKGNCVVIESTEFGQKTLTEWAWFLVEHTRDTTWNKRVLKSDLKRMTLDQILKGLGICADCAEVEDEYDYVVA